jgi:signal transduction protein with GAF and PtsI domain
MENKPEPTLENLLEQINKTLEIIQNHQDPINLSPELLKDIDKLETAVAQFKEDSQELFQLLDIDIEDWKEELLESHQVRSSDKQLIKRAEDIEKEARVMKLALARNRERGNKKTQRDADKQIKERRKLFKPMGGDKKWIPL